MSNTILPLFDKSLQTTAIWLEEIQSEIGPDRAFAWRVLSVVLQNLRDHLPLELSAHFGAQLPMIIRGAFYERFDPTGLPKQEHGGDEFLASISDGLRDSRGVDPHDAVHAVFGVLDRHLSRGQVDKIVRSLPRGIREMWPETELAQ
ncbi:DUF2267 domain-containing protein [Altererythrobacter lutimaris]|uniref:DUF2267 domain-containing protein n=1 Tax=Altererythrobacter lutimaris TaxID=2743979 RepID=A0A850HDV3_9SPHN|nr:DUF2267 domain-containing protein [Altererythrobacter lutimaris]NVE96019.1 DUF2267 domain-containing protein [Altererythrobacter lutimaris]